MIGMNILSKLFYFLTGQFKIKFNNRYDDEKFGDCEVAIDCDSYESSELDNEDGEFDFLTINERLHDGRPLLTVVNHLMTDELKFHMAVWWKQAVVDRSAYSFLIHRVDGDRYLMMLTDDQKAKDDASAWLDEYFSKFQDDKYLEQFIPALPDGEFHGHAMFRNTYEDPNPPTIFQTWTYILTNFHGKVYRTRLDRHRDIFYFEDEAELLMFKMQFVK